MDSPKKSLKKIMLKKMGKEVTKKKKPKAKVWMTDLLKEEMEERERFRLR